MEWQAEVLRNAIALLAAGLGAFFGAKWSESRKLDARFEKLDRIREEVRDVTRVQEEIKHQISSGEWNRQWLLQQKREAYSEAIEIVYKMHSAVALLVHAHRSDESKISAQIDHINGLIPQWLRAQALVSIVGSEPVREAFGIMDSLFPFNKKPEERSQFAFDRISEGVTKLETAMRSEFGA